jgi:hypothetical protein
MLALMRRTLGTKRNNWTDDHWATIAVAIPQECSRKRRKDPWRLNQSAEAPRKISDNMLVIESAAHALHSCPPTPAHIKLAAVVNPGDGVLQPNFENRVFIS